MKKITFLIMVFILSAKGFSQSVSGYAFTASNESYSAVSGTNSTATGDDGSQNNIPIGFSFNFGGISYTTFSISTNGFIRLGNNIDGTNWVNSLANDAAQTPLIAAFWDDHNRNNGAIQYITSGVSPNKIIDIGWNNISISNGGVASNTLTGSFKMRLYETTGQIDFIYGPSITSAGIITASIGLNDLTSFISVTPAESATTSTENGNNDISSAEFLTGRKYSFFPQPQCSGMPTPGATLSSLPTVCANVAFTLSVENQSSDFGLSYQWQSSVNGIAYNNIPNATGSTLVLTHNAPRYYRNTVTCGGQNAVSSPILVGFTSADGCYCFPTYDTGKTDGDLISNVVIAGTALQNNSGAAPVNPSYTFFAGQPNYEATLLAGQNYDVSVTVGTYGQQHVAVWIDYNDDLTFSADERVGYTTEEIGSNDTGIFSIILACDPPAGTHRMRIRDVWNLSGEFINPCENYGYGETEDYNVTIMPGEACQQPYDLNVGSVNSVSAQLLWTGGCGAQSFTAHVGTTGSGISETPSHPDAIFPLTVTGLEPMTAYEFYVMADCGSDGESSWAGPFEFTTAPMAVANDECETAVSLTCGSDFEQNALIGTNLGASKTLGAPNPTCATFGFGGDVWYSAVVPEGGSITFETQSAAGSELIDTGLTVFSGVCGTLTTMSCSDDEGVDAFSKVTLTGLTPGDILYARVWEYANDTFGQFRVSAFTPSLATNHFSSASFKAYPNPVRDVLNFDASQQINTVEVYNLIGQQLITAFGDNINQIDLSVLSRGNYLVKVFSGDQIGTIKIIKE